MIHIFFYAIRVPSGPSQIIPEGFPERVESETGRSGKEGTLGSPSRINSMDKGMEEGPRREDCLEMGGPVGPVATLREKRLEGS